jgi:hypothetical protein
VFGLSLFAREALGNTRDEVDSLDNVHERGEGGRSVTDSQETDSSDNRLRKAKFALFNGDDHLSSLLGSGRAFLVWSVCVCVC